MIQSKDLKKHIVKAIRLLKFTVACFILHFPFSMLHSQDVESVLKAPILVANGGISFSQIANHTSGIQNGQDPYVCYLSGNLNLNLLSVVNIPLSFAYTNQQFNSQASLPFNRFSVAPSYKWAKVYAGYTTMHFSPYTLAGHEILGGGVELSPGNFKISAIYGRLKKAVQEQEQMEPVYQRMGGGLKGEYTGKYADLSVNIFKAKDTPASIHFRNPDSMAVMPQDNLFGSVYFNLKPIDDVRFNMEYGISAINRDISRSDSAGFKLFNNHGDVAIHHAMRTGVTYTSPVGNIGATYERVSPNYTTLGAYYMVNDFENITANLSTSFKNINIAVDGGYQHDNLQEQKNNTTSRMIFSGNVSTTIAQRWGIAANLSNIQSYVHIRDIYDQVTQTNEFQHLDTLNYTQLNYTASLNTSYLLQSSQEQRQSISANFMYQKAAEKQENTAYQGNNIYNTTLAYQYALIPRKFNASTSVNYNHNDMPDSYMGTLSCNLSLQKTFWESFRGAFITTYSNMFNDEKNLAQIVNLRITGGYTFQKRHNFNLSLAMIHNDGQARKTMQYSANLAYSYTFGMSVERKDKKMTVGRNF